MYERTEQLCVYLCGKVWAPRVKCINVIDGLLRYAPAVARDLVQANNIRLSLGHYEHDSGFFWNRFGLPL